MLLSTSDRIGIIGLTRHLQLECFGKLGGEVTIGLTRMLPLLPGQEKVASVVIDPERLWFLDKNMSNNQWFMEKDELAGARWGERAAARASSMLQWFMAVGG